MASLTDWLTPTSMFGVGIFVLLAIIFCFLCLVALTLSYKVPQEIISEQCPSLLFLYSKGLFVGLSRKQGKFRFDYEDDSNETGVIKDGKHKLLLRDCRIDKVKLTQYAILCGYGDEPLFVPPCYLETYFMPLLIALTTSDQFRLSPLGLIHIRQTVTQHTELHHLLREPFDLEATVDCYRHVEKGIEVDVVIKVYDRREMCVWEGMLTLLSRAGKNRGGQSHTKVKNNIQRQLSEEDPSRTADKLILRIPGDLGVQYAKASSDWNPHHLWPWTARLLGYKKPIAHGMWALARSLTWLDRSGKFPIKAPFHVDVQFKRPIFMPGSCLFTFHAQAHRDNYVFRIEDEETHAPQLLGRVQKVV